MISLLERKVERLQGEKELKLYANSKISIRQCLGNNILMNFGSNKHQQKTENPIRIFSYLREKE